MANAWDDYILPGTSPLVSSSYYDPNAFDYFSKQAQSTDDEEEEEDNKDTGSGGDSEDSGESFDIPEDAFPYATSNTSLPDWGLGTVKDLTGRMPGLLDSIEGYATQLANPSTVDDWVAQNGKAWWAGIDPFASYIRAPFERANSRGLGDGTMLRDITVNLGGLLSDDYSKTQATVGADAIKQKSTNLAEAGSLLGSAYDYTGGLLDSAKVSTSYQEDKSQIYEMMANLLLS